MAASILNRAITYVSDAVSRLGGPLSTMGQHTNGVPTEIEGTLSGWGEPPQLLATASMATLQGAMRTAEYGDTYYLFALYRDFIVNSCHIQTEFGKRVMAVIGQKQSIQAASKEGPDAVNKEVIEDMIHNCDNWIDGQLHLMQGHVWPVAACEKIFEKVPPEEQFKFRHPVRYRLKRLHPVPYALFNYRVAYWGVGSNSNPNEANDVTMWSPNDWEPDLRFWNTLANGQINWSMGDAYKPSRDRHVIHRGNFLISFRDNYGGAMRGICFWGILAGMARDWFGRFMERYGAPFAVAKVDAKQKDLMDAVMKAFNTSTKIGGLMVPRNVEIELKEAAVSGSADGYEKFISLCHREISKIMVGQEMSTVATAAGLGSGQAGLQGEVRQDIREFDEKKLSDTLRTQIFEQYLRINGYPGRAPSSVWGGLSTVDKVEFGKVLESLTKSGFEVDDDSIETVNENIGLCVRRAPKPELAEASTGKAFDNAD